jgi:hypothetical protein
MALAAEVWVRLSGLGPDLSQALALSGPSAIMLDEAIADGSTDLQVACAFALTGLQAFLLVSDQALTVKTNNSGAPQETLAIAAGKPLIYLPGTGAPALFAGAVTALFVTNASGATAALKVRVLHDSTP